MSTPCQSCNSTHAPDAALDASEPGPPEDRKPDDGPREDQEDSEPEDDEAEQEPRRSYATAKSISLVLGAVTALVTTMGTFAVHWKSLQAAEPPERAPALASTPPASPVDPPTFAPKPAAPAMVAASLDHPGEAIVASLRRPKAKASKPPNERMDEREDDEDDELDELVDELNELFDEVEDDELDELFDELDSDELDEADCEMVESCELVEEYACDDPDLEIGCELVDVYESCEMVERC